jgi:hypothetical protein
VHEVRRRSTASSSTVCSSSAVAAVCRDSSSSSGTKKRAAEKRAARAGLLRAAVNKSGVVSGRIFEIPPHVLLIAHLAATPFGFFPSACLPMSYKPP